MVIGSVAIRAQPTVDARSPIPRDASEVVAHRVECMLLGRVLEHDVEGGLHRQEVDFSSMPSHSRLRTASPRNAVLPSIVICGLLVNALKASFTSSSSSARRMFLGLPGIGWPGRPC